MCVYFSTILKASKEYTAEWWWLYDFQYRQQVAATQNTDWSVLSHPSSAGASRAKVLSCTNCGSLKHDTQDCQRCKGKQSANQESSSLPLTRPKPNVCYNFNYKWPYHTSPCPLKYACLSCQSDDHPMLDSTRKSWKRNHNPSVVIIIFPLVGQSGIAFIIYPFAVNSYTSLVLLWWLVTSL